MDLNLTKNDLLKAIVEIDNKPNLRSGRQSSTYDLIYNKKSYPPILVISIANELKGGKEIKLEDFNNKTDVPFKLLRDNGFELMLKNVGILKNYKEEYKNWIQSDLADKSGAPSSYIACIDYLSEKFFQNNEIIQKSIFEITDLDVISKLYELTKKLQKEKNSYVYNPASPSYGDKNFYSASLGSYMKFLKLHFNATIPSFLNSFLKDLKNCGLLFSDKLVSRFIASLLTKPFVILTGLSGSGKTKLAQSFVQWICADKKQYCIVPVGADWTNREPLLGYLNALNSKEYVKPDNGVLDLIIQANENPTKPYFLILDEMNLSHVERYFADFLSVMESKEEIPLHDSNLAENVVAKKLIVPSNFLIIGTVNIDETTNMFSPKVLDRANTIEFRITQMEMENFLNNISDVNLKAIESKGANMAHDFVIKSNDKSIKLNEAEIVNGTLIMFFGELKKTGAEFGYRSASEIQRLISQLSIIDESLTTHQKLDFAIMQKLLPKLHGSRRKLLPILETLASFCVNDSVKINEHVLGKPDFDFQGENVLYPLSLEKITRMHKSAIENGFASFAEA